MRDFSQLGGIMKIRNFLSGVILGTALTILFSAQHYGDKIEEFTAEHVNIVVDLKAKQAKQLEEAWDYALEECPELFTGFMALQDENLELKQALLNATIKCEWMIQDAEKERPECPEVVCFATVQEMRSLIEQLTACENGYQ